MARKNEKQPAVVAELGRPETPEETAARKAESSRKHRANQSTVNLLLSLAASLGIVLILVLIVVRPAPPAPDPVDYMAIAEQAQPDAADALIAPALPPGWTANRASLESAPGGTLNWYVGFLTPEREFIALEQGLGLSEAWLPALVGSAEPSGSVQIAGIEWQVYDRRESSDTGNFAYSLYAEENESQFLLHGSAGDAEFQTLASAVAAEIPGEER